MSYRLMLLIEPENDDNPSTWEPIGKNFKTKDEAVRAKFRYIHKRPASFTASKAMADQMGLDSPWRIEEEIT